MYKSQVCFSGVTNAQTRKQREDAKREAWKKERQEKKALEAQQDSVSYVPVSYTHLDVYKRQDRYYRTNNASG